MIFYVYNLTINEIDYQLLITFNDNPLFLNCQDNTLLYN